MTTISYAVHVVEDQVKTYYCLPIIKTLLLYLIYSAILIIKTKNKS